MKSRLIKYFDVMEKYPQLFENKESPTLKVIKDIVAIQEKESELKKRLSEKGLPEEYADIGVLVDDPYFLIVRDLAEFPNGDVRGYIRFINKASLKNAQAVAILPVYNNKIVLIRNFRHATRNWEIEIPRGFGEDGFSPEDNAKKELFEETGLTPIRILKLGSLNTDTAARSPPVILFYAEVSKPKTISFDANELISDILLLNQKDFEQMIKNEKITDGFTISSYCMAKILGLL